MTIIGSDNLSVLVGDGEVSESFTTLRGMTLSRFEITQRVLDSTAVQSDAWQVGVGVAERRALIECEFAATDEAAATRLRSLALSGNTGNVRLETRATEKVACAVYVTEYREITRPGEIKRVRCQLVSTGTVSLI